MLRLSEIKALLEDRNAALVGRKAGVHPNVVRAIRNGKKTNVASTTLERLSDYLERQNSSPPRG